MLIGPLAKIQAVAVAEHLDLGDLPIVDAPHSHAAAARAVEMARAGQFAALMKGSLETGELLTAVVSSRNGLRTARRITHVYVIDVPSHPKVLLVSDAAVNICPSLEEKVDIVQNAIDLAHVIGIPEPKVAILSAIEKVNPKIPSTVEAAALCKMADRGQITGGVVDGPLAFDNAISLEAARKKQIESPVAGRADILITPDLEAGNMLVKQLVFMAGADGAGIVMGARVPIVLTSRADSVRTRLASIAVANLVANARRAKVTRNSMRNHGRCNSRIECGLVEPEILCIPSRSAASSLSTCADSSKTCIPPPTSPPTTRRRICWRITIGSASTSWTTSKPRAMCSLGCVPDRWRR